MGPAGCLFPKPVSTDLEGTPTTHQINITTAQLTLATSSEWNCLDLVFSCRHRKNVNKNWTRVPFSAWSFFLSRMYFLILKEKSFGDNKVWPYLCGMTLSELQMQADIAFSHPSSPTHLSQERKDRRKYLLSKAVCLTSFSSSKESIAIFVIVWGENSMLRNNKAI